MSFTSALGSGDAIISSVSSWSSNMTNQVNAQNMIQTTQIQVEEMQTSMAAAAEKAEWNKWKIVQDTQNKIYEIQQTVTVDKAKTQDKMFNKWDEYIKS